MAIHDSSLDGSFRDLSDAFDDFFGAPYQNAASILQRFVVAFHAEPLAGFLRSILPVVDFPAWLAATMASRGGMVGSGAIQWPADRAERVAMQVALIEYLAGNEEKLLDFAHEFCHSGYNNISADFRNFADTVLRPFLRDLGRLTENRAVPPVLFDAMGSLPSSGDVVLDGLLEDARSKFKDPAPATRKEGLERLWDAWERLKSLEVEGNKKLSVAALLDRSSTSSPFRELLKEEARALTNIGNQFHIRHFETNKARLDDDGHVDYLFHRLFSLMHLLLYARTS